jgi:arabinan endo-1,5-alpha-L-arabinosidase
MLTVLMAVLLMEASATDSNRMPLVHDPAIIRQGQSYYLFSTGRGIPIRVSTDMVHWQRVGRVFENDSPQWAKEAYPEATWLWAPDISFSRGLYRVYYSVSSFGSQRSAIGLVVNRTLDATDPNYKWEDRGMVIDSAPGRCDFNSIDADAFTDADGQAWLVFGSFWSGIKMVSIDPESGMPRDPNVLPIAGRPGNTAIEGACLMRHDGYYYLFASFDLCCKGVDSTYKIMVGRSRVVTGPYVDRNSVEMLAGGGSLVLAGDENWKGPGHNEILQDGEKEYLVHHAYDVHNDGRATLLVRPLTWDKDGWPIAGKPLEP